MAIIICFGDREDFFRRMQCEEIYDRFENHENDFSMPMDGISGFASWADKMKSTAHFLFFKLIPFVANIEIRIYKDGSNNKICHSNMANVGT